MPAARLVGLIVLIIAIVITGYVIWFYGTTTFIGVPLQIILVTLALPLILVSLIFWFSGKQEQQAWRAGVDE